MLLYVIWPDQLPLPDPWYGNDAEVVVVDVVVDAGVEVVIVKGDVEIVVFVVVVVVSVDVDADVGIKVVAVDVGRDVVVIVCVDFDEQEQEAGITIDSTINPIARQDTTNCICFLFIVVFPPTCLMCLSRL